MDSLVSLWLVRPKKLILRSGTILLAVGCWHIATYDAAAVAATITIELTYLQDAAQIEMGIESSEVNVRNVSKKNVWRGKSKNMNNTCSFVYFNGDLFSAIPSSPFHPLSLAPLDFLRLFILLLLRVQHSWTRWVLLFRHVDFFSLYKYFIARSMSMCGWCFFTTLSFSTSVYFWFMIFNNINLLHCVRCLCKIVDLLSFSVGFFIALSQNRKLFFFRGFSRHVCTKQESTQKLQTHNCFCVCV